MSRTSYPKLPKEKLNSRGKLVSLKEKLNENSKQLEQSAEKLSQLESENLNLRDENKALNTASNKKSRFRAQVCPMSTLEIPNSGTGVNLSLTASGGDASTREKAKDAQTDDVEDSESEPEPDKEAPDGATKAEFPMVAYLEQMFSKRLDAMQSMITLIEMPRKFSFPSIMAYDGTTDPDDHVAQYRQTMLTIALPKDSREATMCKGFGSTLTGPALQWYINLPSRSIASFTILSDKFVEQFASSMDLEKTSEGLYEILRHQAEPLRGYIARLNQEKVAIPECSIPTAISAFKTCLLPDGDLYKELTKYKGKTMEDVLSRAWAQVKWEEDVASRAKNRPIEKAEGMAVSTWLDISHLSISRPELINVLRQMGQQVKCPQKMKAPDSFRNPGFWCDFHRDHGHKTEDCVALKIEVNEFLKKGHLRDSEISCISHAAAKKSTKHLERQVRPRGSQAKTPAPRYERNKFHGQGARESSHPTSRRPGHIAHCSELPGEKDTGR
ncbi:hypothetical protein DY000_02030947 [Brassica cretica]|uniref:Retrotransposon gag domain-containing protein n=1 Tax=Brassica cretica TaxID=69181 RepID=A0ABQ7DS69_BRACR|nr:hypothetical protein DY000_02030947 [Brassica cretica]